MTTLAPLEDPTYEPKHPPINGQPPDVVAKWGPRSQVRWFRRFHGSVTIRDWRRFFVMSIEHRDVCCQACFDPDEYWDGEECCCRGFAAAGTRPAS